MNCAFLFGQCCVLVKFSLLLSSTKWTLTETQLKIGLSDLIAETPTITQDFYFKPSVLYRRWSLKWFDRKWSAGNFTEY